MYSYRVATSIGIEEFTADHHVIEGDGLELHWPTGIAVFKDFIWFSREKND